MFLECFRMIYLLYNDLLATLEFFFIANRAALTRRPLPHGRRLPRAERRERSRRPPAAGGQAAFVLKGQNTYFVEIPRVPLWVLAENRTGVRGHRVNARTLGGDFRRAPERQFSLSRSARRNSRLSCEKNVVVTTSVRSNLSLSAACCGPLTSRRTSLCEEFGHWAPYVEWPLRSGNPRFHVTGCVMFRV